MKTHVLLWTAAFAAAQRFPRCSDDHLVKPTISAHVGESNALDAMNEGSPHFQILSEPNLPTKRQTLGGTLAFTNQDQPGLTLSYTTTAPADDNYIGIYPFDGPVPPEQGAKSLAWVYAKLAKGDATLPTAGLKPGKYKAALLSGSYQRLTGLIDVDYGKSTLAVAKNPADLTFDYTTTTPAEDNYIGIYAATGPLPPDPNGRSLTWTYAKLAKGQVAVPPKGLAAGKYRVVLLSASYQQLAGPIDFDYTGSKGSLALAKDKPAVTFNYETASPDADNYIGIYSVKGPFPPVSGARSLAWVYAPLAKGEANIAPPKNAVQGGLMAGETYQAVLFSGTYQLLAGPVQFVYSASPPATGTLALAKDKPDLTFDYTASKPDAGNYIGLFSAGDKVPPDTPAAKPLVSMNVARAQGQVTLDTNALDAGKYQAYLLSVSSQRLSGPVEVQYTSKPKLSVKAASSSGLTFDYTLPGPVAGSYIALYDQSTESPATPGVKPLSGKASISSSKGSVTMDQGTINLLGGKYKAFVVSATSQPLAGPIEVNYAPSPGMSLLSMKPDLTFRVITPDSRKDVWAIVVYSPEDYTAFSNVRRRAFATIPQTSPLVTVSVAPGPNGSPTGLEAGKTYTASLANVNIGGYYGGVAPISFVYNPTG